MGLVRTQGGKVIHRASCLYITRSGAATTAAPWRWAEDRETDEVFRIAIGLGARPCTTCRPFDASKDPA